MHALRGQYVFDDTDNSAYSSLKEREIETEKVRDMERGGQSKTLEMARLREMQEGERSRKTSSPAGEDSKISRSLTSLSPSVGEDSKEWRSECYSRSPSEDKAFSEADVNRDGVIDREEFRASYQRGGFAGLDLSASSSPPSSGIIKVHSQRRMDTNAGDRNTEEEDEGLTLEEIRDMRGT